MEMEMLGRDRRGEGLEGWGRWNEMHWRTSDLVPTCFGGDAGFVGWQSYGGQQRRFRPRGGSTTSRPATAHSEYQAGITPLLLRTRAAVAEYIREF